MERITLFEQLLAHTAVDHTSMIFKILSANKKHIMKVKSPAMTNKQNLQASGIIHSAGHLYYFEAFER